MKISALIPTYNRRKYVSRAIESVLAQTRPADEILVLDDGSTDGTAEFVESKYGSHVRIVRQENVGVSGARRRAIVEARNEWIAFLDSDDEWLPGRNELLFRAAASLPPEVAWLFADMRIVTDEGEGRTFFEEYGLKLKKDLEIFQDPLVVQFPFQFCMLQGSLIRRQALLDANCFAQGLRSDEDLLAGFQMACKYKFAAIPAVVTRFYRTSDLFSTSLEYNGRHGVDYYRSRMMAFSLVIATGRKKPWNRHYAHQVRGLCKLRATKGQPVRGLAFEQFRYGATLKSLAFWSAAMFGASGLRLWSALGKVRSRNASDSAAAIHANLQVRE